MKFEIEIPDPKFKVGEVIELMCGKDRDTPFPFAICAITGLGTWSFGRGPKPQSGRLEATEVNYLLSCQVDHLDDPMSNWFTRRSSLCLDAYGVDLTAKLLKWDKPILPMATSEYYSAKWALQRRIEEGAADVQELRDLSIYHP